MTHPQQHSPQPAAASADFHAVVNKVEKRSGDATIPEQPGCGPNVTDYPGMGDQPEGGDAQSTGSDA